MDSRVLEKFALICEEGFHIPTLASGYVYFFFESLGKC